MMRPGIIIFIIFVLIIVTLGSIYYFKELPQKELIDKTVNVTLSAKLSANYNQKIEVSYAIDGITTTYSTTGKTTEFGSVLEHLPFNYTYTIYTTGLADYYKEEIELITSKIKIYRVDFILKSPGNIDISKTGELNGVDNLTIKLDVGGYLKQPIICTRWGMHIVSLNIINNNSIFSEIESLDYASKYFKCYQYNKLFNNENIDFVIDYKYWEQLDARDFIEIIVMDHEFTNLNKTIRYIV